jgi:hypothetical protein
MAEIVHGILIRLRGQEESSAKAPADATDQVRVMRSRSTHQRFASSRYITRRKITSTQQPQPNILFVLADDTLA